VATNELIILLTTATSIGFFHTLFGPDHYLPFIVLSKANRWSILKTGVVTFLCGLGHIMSSVILGFIGIGLGISVFKLESIESARAEIAAWLLIIFGFTYFIWGMHKIFLRKPHAHFHQHDDSAHYHAHNHLEEHSHIHNFDKKQNLTPWILFTIFIFGPCEPLIPILMYPAAKGDMMAVLLVVSVFGLMTITTMMVLVLCFAMGLAKIPLSGLIKYSHALAGLIILLCGGAIKFLGL
jgi:sulfite exporter TauE/SafE